MHQVALRDQAETLSFQSIRNVFAGDDDSGLGNSEVRARRVAIWLEIKLKHSNQSAPKFFNPRFKEGVTTEDFHLVRRQRGECRFVCHSKFAFIA